MLGIEELSHLKIEVDNGQIKAVKVENERITNPDGSVINVVIKREVDLEEISKEMSSLVNKVRSSPNSPQRKVNEKS